MATFQHKGTGETRIVGDDPKIARQMLAKGWRRVAEPEAAPAKRKAGRPKKAK